MNMELIDLRAELTGNSYPGRGIILGKSADDKKAVIAYFIMGRSENSRNRVFCEDLNDGLRTKAFDETRLVDPSLVIYAPVRVLSNYTIVTNGDQTDTIFEFMDEGGHFEEALRTRTFEPDPPLFTPRISGLIDEKGDGSFSYKLSILKSNKGDESSPLRFFYEYETPKAGEGHFIHTYHSDGNPPQSFFGEPKAVSLPDNSIDIFTDMLWSSLNSDNKISLFTRYINLETGELESRIVNKHQM